MSLTLSKTLTRMTKYRVKQFNDYAILKSHNLCASTWHMTHGAQFYSHFFLLSILNDPLSALVNAVKPLAGQTLAEQMKKGCEKKVKRTQLHSEIRYD